MNNKYLQIGFLVILAVIAVVLLKRPMPVKQEAQITDFQSCVNAGGTVANGVCTAPSGYCCFVEQPQPQPQTAPDVVVDSPLPNALIISPVTVSGKARGTWYFEANLPVILKDGNGNILAQKGFQSIGDWMTTDYVSFSDTLSFTMPVTQYGTLEIHNDNPSGDPINEKVFPVPVKFW